MQKKNILMLCDHPLSTSGVGTQARYLIKGLVDTGKYSFRVFGGAIKHENYETIVVNDDFVIKPTDGFGDRNLLRKALAQIKPDALLLFTDPRFFIWVWEMEDEIHQVCPIAYNHLWDNDPWPEYNRVLYESTDLVNCINWPTYQMTHERFPEKTNYIPHAVPEDLFKPLPENVRKNLKMSILGLNRAEHFVCLYVSRNARRKMTGDVLVSWKIFLDKLQATHGHRNATLILHTDPFDPEGSNLHVVIDMLKIKDNVVFSKDRVGFNEMNNLYNIADAVVSRSCFVAGSRVLTKNGFVPIEEINVGDLVMTHKRRWRPVVDLIRNDGKGKKIITINYSNGNPITCTDDHKIMAIKKSSLPKNFLFNETPNIALEYAKLTPCNELSVGDYVVSMHENRTEEKQHVFDMFQYVSNDSYVRKCGKKMQTYFVENDKIMSSVVKHLDHGPTHVTLDENLAYVMGNWAADGTTNTTSVAFDKKHADKIKTYISSVEASLKMECSVSERTSHFMVTVKNGHVLALMLKDKCGSYSGGKKIPDEIKTSSKSVKEAFLRGYLAGDGCVLTHPQYGHQTYRIRTVSDVAAADIRELLIDLGYVPSVIEGNNDHGYNKNGRIWTIEWRNRQRLNNGSCRSWNINGTIVSRIYDIQEEEEHETVYDLTVEDDHTYMVENVTVSNCNEGFGLSVLEGKMCEKPIVSIKTGGLTRQIVDHESGEEYGVALDPEIRSLVGNQLVPYIYEDFVSNETFASGILKLYDMGPEKRASIGAAARRHALKNYNLNNLIDSWDKSLTDLFTRWEKQKLKRWNHVELLGDIHENSYRKRPCYDTVWVRSAFQTDC